MLAFLADNALWRHSPNRLSQTWRLVAFKAGIVASEELAFQPVRFEQDISRNALPLDLQELSEAVDGHSDGPMDQRVPSRHFDVAAAPRTERRRTLASDTCACFRGQSQNQLAALQLPRRPGLFEIWSHFQARPES
jgi:hypothetical protein